MKAYIAVQESFEDTRPDEFLFEYLPSSSESVARMRTDFHGEYRIFNAKHARAYSQLLWSGFVCKTRENKENFVFFAPDLLLMRSKTYAEHIKIFDPPFFAFLLVMVPVAIVPTGRNAYNTRRKPGESLKELHIIPVDHFHIDILTDDFAQFRCLFATNVQHVLQTIVC